MKKRVVAIVTVVLILVIAIFTIKKALDNSSRESNEQIKKELTDKTAQYLEALNQKDMEKLKSLHTKDFTITVDENYILGFLTNQKLLSGVEVNIKDFYCKPVEILSNEFLNDLSSSRESYEKDNEYPMKVIVEFGVQGEKNFRQKWKIYFSKEDDTYKISDTGTIVNTLTEINKIRSF